MYFLMCKSNLTTGTNLGDSIHNNCKLTTETSTWFWSSYLPEAIECGVILKAKDGRRQGGADQSELEDGVDLADGGRLDLGGGQGHVEVLLNAELQWRIRLVHVNSHHCHCNL